MTDASWQILTGDCVDRLRELPDASVDAIVTDPPYGLEFMGKSWDRLDRGADVRQPFRGEVQTPDNPYGRTPVRYGYDNAPRAMQEWHEAWAREALRVLKPGGHLLAFGGTRTYHRLACAVEDAGFEIRDSLMWIQGSGFPKSLSPYRSELAGLCGSTEHARRAVRVSKWHPLALPEGKAPTALALAETQPEGDLVLLTRTGGEAGSPAQMATWPFEPVTGTSLSTDSSWNACSDVLWNGTSMSITETASRTTTDPRTLKFFASMPTPPSITPDEWRPFGCSCDVVPAAEISSDGVVRWSDTPTSIAPASATGRLVPLKPLGSAAKPAHEPVVVARKPLVGTVAGNVLEFGTGALNVDGCRIAATVADVEEQRQRTGGVMGADDGRAIYGAGKRAPAGNAAGRWPANVLVSHADGCRETGTRRVRTSMGRRGSAESADVGAEQGMFGIRATGEEVGYADVDGLEDVPAWECVEGCPVAELDRQSGMLQSGKAAVGGHRRYAVSSEGIYGGGRGLWQAPGSAGELYGDRGGASRFFYTAKSSSAERNAGLDGFEEQRKPDGMHSIPSRECNVCGVRTKKPGLPWPTCGHEDWRWVEVREGRHHGQMRNVHPTVKPLDVMRWLVRLVTPPNGLILDPFAGSGTTGCAAALEGFRFLGVEREAEYVPIAEARIRWWSQWPVGLSTAECLRRDAQRRGVLEEAEERRREREGAGQLDILSLLEGEDAA
jgi:DNA modification methylase